MVVRRVILAKVGPRAAIFTHPVAEVRPSSPTHSVTGKSSITTKQAGIGRVLLLEDVVYRVQITAFESVTSRSDSLTARRQLWGAE
jgi:hypothetical protein